jgi:hypothetical protein
MQAAIHGKPVGTAGGGSAAIGSSAPWVAFETVA